MLKAGKPIARGREAKAGVGTRKRTWPEEARGAPCSLDACASGASRGRASPLPQSPLPLPASDSPFRPRWHRRRLLGPPGGGGGGNTLQYGQAARRSSSATPLRCRTTSQRRRGITVAGPPAVTLRVRPCWFRFPAWYPTSPLSSRPAILRQPRTRGRTGRHALDLWCPLGIA